MVFVTMGQHDTSDFVDIFCQIGYIRDDQIDPQHIILRESKTAVDDDDIIAVFQHSHVFADLFQTAQRDHFQLCLGFCFCLASGAQFRCYLRCRFCCRLRCFFRRFLCRGFRCLCSCFRCCFHSFRLCFRLCICFRFGIFYVHFLCVLFLCQKTHLLFLFSLIYIFIVWRKKVFFNLQNHFFFANRKRAVGSHCLKKQSRPVFSAHHECCQNLFLIPAVPFFPRIYYEKGLAYFTSEICRTIIHSYQIRT